MQQNLKLELLLLIEINRQLIQQILVLIQPLTMLVVLLQILMKLIKTVWMRI